MVRTFVAHGITYGLKEKNEMLAGRKKMKRKT
jgi:hypothetical protein